MSERYYTYHFYNNKIIHFNGYIIYYYSVVNEIFTVRQKKLTVYIVRCKYFLLQVKAGTKMGLMFEVAEGGFLGSFII